MALHKEFRSQFYFWHYGLIVKLGVYLCYCRFGHETLAEWSRRDQWRHSQIVDTRRKMPEMDSTEV